MANQLQEETSPYLLQHADNPVQWYAWNKISLELAKKSGKPILLSIGYSACHWCHVMAHESFEDQETAQLMNKLFINIKVDREERPDLDKIYQTAHHIITRRSGGWPLTVFLTPDNQLPIFAGTYFPKEPRYGIPSFQDVLRRVETYYRENELEVRSQTEKLSDMLENLDQSPKVNHKNLDHTPLEQAKQKLSEIFDGEYGGFGDAPKFPHPTNIEMLLDAWRNSAEESDPDLQSLFMATLSLTRMANGGLYDQLGGGFFRYSVDRYWLIPHFEKMLYDNAALLALYANASAATGDTLFEKIASETANWVMREMQDPEGGYYATLDADSEGEEGKFYLWTQEEFESLLDTDEAKVAGEYFGLTDGANFENASHLYVAKSLDSLAENMALSVAKTRELLDHSRIKLLNTREQRVRPHKDVKVLTSWNGLMIGGMAVAARCLAREDLAISATQAVDFIRSKLWNNGRLKACYKDKRARFPAYLDDYAFLIHGILELLQYRWRSEDLALAQELVEVLLSEFEDDIGGFFFTANDHEPLILRPKPFTDEAMPSGNGIAVQVLIVLGHLLGEERYLRAAQRTLAAAAEPGLRRYPEAHNSMLRGLDAYLSPPEIIIIRGEPSSLKEWQRFVHAGYNPKRVCLSIPTNEKNLPGLLADRKPQGSIVAYICRGTECRPPITSLETLEKELVPVKQAHN